MRLDGGLAMRAPGGSRAGACSGDDVWATPSPAARATRAAGPGCGTDSGTTCATAHTAGIAGLLAARGAGRDEVVECLRASVTGGGPVDGAGTVDALRAVRCGSGA